MNWMILLVVPAVLVLLMFVNLYILLKQIKSNEDRIITNIVVIQKDLVRLNEEHEQILKQLKSIPKEITVSTIVIKSSFNILR